MAEVSPWGTSAAFTGTADRLATGLYSPGNRLAKAAVEWVAALVLALALLPVLVAIALLVRRDGGPALFAQQREGLHGRPLRVYKFRSMRVEACNPDARSSLDATGPRVTPLGAVLRRTGLDELPQLFNVLNGDMSLIGRARDADDRRQRPAGAARARERGGRGVVRVDAGRRRG